MYIMFDDKHWLRSGQWVLSTEAHPMFISGKPIPGVPRGQGGLKAASEGSPVGSRKKCPRRSSVDRKSSCGIGMPGTDFPPFDLAMVRRTAIPEDVQKEVRQRILTGEPPLEIGEVLLGSVGGFRVSRISQRGGVELEAVAERR